MVATCGVMVIESKVGSVTVREVEPVIAPEVALMIVVPGATPVDKPVLLIVAAAGVPEVQVTLAVMF